jgi:glycerophosphoryl diester phosphodiesterase
VVDAQAARVLRVTKNGEPFYEWQGVTVIAHRGASRFAPENTIAAFEKAIALGADLIEIDIRETKDGHLVIMHDVTVDRTTNGSGAVADLALAEIKQLDAGSSFSAEFKGEKVPTLDEALEAMKGRALPDLDFKAGTPEKLVDAVRRHGLLGKVTLYAGDYDLLRRTLAISKEFHARPSIYIGRAGLPMLLKELNPPIVNIDWREFSEGLIRDVHVSGRQAFVNVMGPNDNEFGILAVIDAGADFIQSDRPDILVPLLRSRGIQRRPTDRPLVSQR